jgi:hypothetical protein
MTCPGHDGRQHRSCRGFEVVEDDGVRVEKHYVEDPEGEQKLLSLLLGLLEKRKAR